MARSRKKTKQSKKTGEAKASKTTAPKKDDAKEQRKSLEEFDVADGKDRKKEREEEIKKHKELEELLGVKDINPYQTHNEEVFKEKMDHMTRDELMSLAARVGVTPTRDRIRIKKDLLESFKTFAKRSGISIPEAPKPIAKKGDKNYSDIKKLFES